MSINKQKDFKTVGTRPIRPDGLDKVTGRAKYGADLNLAGMLYGRIVRSPHAHAIIKSIDFSAALAMPGVVATMTSEDLPDPGDRILPGAEIEMKLKDISPIIMARGKVLFHSQAVAAVAATSEAVAAEAAKRVVVEYEVLPHVLDIDASLKDGAPLVHDDLFTQGRGPAPTSPSNLAADFELNRGDVDAGFAEADLVIERDYFVPMCHQGYIEPHACVAQAGGDGKVEIWCSTQGHFMVRNMVAELVGIDRGMIKVTASEIGGGFGGKTTVYIEPVAVVLARKSGRPVKIVMTRDEVFRASGPVSSARTRVKIGAKSDGTFTAIETSVIMDSGAYSSSPILPSAMFSTACYRCDNLRSRGREVLTNKPKVWAYRGPGAPQSMMAVECAVNEMAQGLCIDPLDLRLMNAVEEGDVPIFELPFQSIGLKQVIEEARNHPNYQVALEENQGRGVAAGFWINAGMQSSAAIHVVEDGSLTVLTGNPDIGGSRASMAMLAAEVLGVAVETVRPAVADTDSVGFCDATGGSRTTLATGSAVMKAAGMIMDECKQRAAAIWSVDVKEVEWSAGRAVVHSGIGMDELRASLKAGVVVEKILTLAELAEQAGATGGPLTASASVHAHSAQPSFAVNICDAQVDPDTGKVDILRYTCVQDAGKAVHPAYVEGQMQGRCGTGYWLGVERGIYLR